MVGSGEEARPVVGLFKCSWINLGSSLTGDCGMRTGGLRMSLRLVRPEKDGVVAVSGLSLVDVFAAGTSPSDAASPSEDGGEEADGGGKGGYSGT
jgi:hypothetical protein